MPSLPINAGKTRTLTLRVAMALLLVLVAVGAFVFFRSQREPEVTVGVEGQRTIEIAGPQLSAAPFTPGDALAVRIAAVHPTATGYRYDLRYMAFGPGEHDIGKSLAGPDGKPPASQPEFAVTIKALIPEDYSGELYATPNSAINLHTNYRLLMTLAWGLWALLLIPLVWYGRDWSSHKKALPPEPSVTERLRALLQQANSNELTAKEQADLEQLLIAFWSQRLNLSEQRLNETIHELRSHPQAGPQWNSVEHWLHSSAAHTNGIAAKLLREIEALA
jgi:hypothetical protein